MSDDPKSFPLRFSPPEGDDEASKLKKGDRDTWTKKLGEWAYQLTVLKVVTFVGNATVTTTGDGLPNTLQIGAANEAAAYVTVADLIGGDVTNIIPPGADPQVQDFHTQQVAHAGTILPNNLKLLGELVQSLFKK